MPPPDLYAIGDYLSAHSEHLSERLAKRPAVDSPIVARIAQLDRWASELYAEAHLRELPNPKFSPLPSGPIPEHIRLRWVPYAKNGGLPPVEYDQQRNPAAEALVLRRGGSSTAPNGEIGIQQGRQS